MTVSKTELKRTSIAVVWTAQHAVTAWPAITPATAKAAYAMRPARPRLEMTASRTGKKPTSTAGDPTERRAKRAKPAWAPETAKVSCVRMPFADQQRVTMALRMAEKATSIVVEPIVFAALTVKSAPAPLTASVSCARMRVSVRCPIALIEFKMAQKRTSTAVATNHQPAV